MNTGTSLQQPSGYSSSQLDLSLIGGSMSTIPNARGKRFPNKAAMMRWTQNFVGPGCDPTSVLLKRDELEELLQEHLPFAVIAELLKIFTHHEFRDTGRTERILQLVANSPLIRNPKNLKAYLIKLSGTTPPASPIYEENMSNALIFISDIMGRYPQYTEILGLDLLQISADKLQAAYPKHIFDASRSIVATGKEILMGTSNHSGASTTASSLAFSSRPSTSTISTTHALQALHELKQIDRRLSGDHNGSSVRSEDLDDDDDEEATNKGATETPIVDFRELPLFPTISEIMDESDFVNKRIAKNIVKGKYDSLAHYLDTHFRLLREDAITSIRDGIKAYRSSLSSSDESLSSGRGQAAKPSEISVYKDVRLTGICPTLAGIVYRVSFRLDSQESKRRPPASSSSSSSYHVQVDWSRSKRLLYGSLVCVSPDNFDSTLLWATVANRDVSLLSISQEVDLKFPEEFTACLDPSMTYTMVESNSTYFEAYRHVLTALKTTNTHNFPFMEYLINCECNIDSPSYLHTGSSIYNMTDVFGNGPSQFDILDPNWSTSKIKTNMDDSQLDALKHALTKEIAVIQGPPGTGKTFVGLKVMRALLDNRELRGVGNVGPIMIVCYTNHALDQFLEGVLSFESNVIRIGSRSKSDLLKDKNLKSLVYEAHLGPAEHSKVRRQLLGTLKELQESIEVRFQDLCNTSLYSSDLAQVCQDEQQLASLFGASLGLDGESNALENWLGLSPAELVKQLKSPRFATKLHAASYDADFPALQHPTSSGNSTPTPTSASHSPSPSSRSYPSSSTLPPMDWNDEYNSDDDFLEQAEEIDKMAGESFSLKMTQLKTDGLLMAGLYEGESLDEATISCVNVWKLPKSERQRLYIYWLVSFRRRIVSPDLAELCDRYEHLCQQKQMIDQDAQVQLLMSSAVIGLTTTGVAKFQKLIRAVGPPIVIVEEAAEVLEAHIVTALTSSTKHMILIGDHEQLRPSTAVYRLALKYKLDVSLFERLIKNGLPVNTLSKQRRMRPEISKLIAPIYPMLTDHPDVLNRPNVLGVASNVFFIDHQMPESSDAETMGLSKTNPHEAAFLARLTAHLLFQGYSSHQVTLLTAYSGQAKLIRQELRHLNKGEVYVTSVDNFQGQECDIICLSLVRNNSKSIIGFLNTSNRICVALSRARIGLYIMGNAAQLSTANALWKSVVDSLRSTNSIGPSLLLECQKHPAKVTSVSYVADFKLAEDGGCDLKCEQTLPCGHACPRLCHPYPHSMVLCNQPCERIHPECGHRCTKRCYQDCGHCEIQTLRTLACGHEALVPCSEDDPPCSKLVNVTLPCSHTITALCREVSPSDAQHKPKSFTCPVCPR